MQITQNQPLREYNTFHIPAITKYFVEINTEEEFQLLRERAEYKSSSRLILGGGSNVLFTRNYDGLVIRNRIPGKQLLHEDSQYHYVRAGAGENWHGFVSWCIENNYPGLENLSLIPGCVGASPMQNIGAYGVEVKDVFHELEALHVESGERVHFSKEDCNFGYRESVFKRKYKDQFIITSVSFRLRKNAKLNTSYGAIEKELEVMGINNPDIKTVSEAVIRIRSSKLPNPDVLGNAGSFFKNPEISAEQYTSLKQKHEHIVAYPLESGNVKLAAGWLIEQCGWKGKRVGDAGVHAHQALVLVNYGGAAGKDIYDLSQHVLDSVQEKFGVQLEREVNII